MNLLVNNCVVKSKAAHSLFLGRIGLIAIPDRIRILEIISPRQELLLEYSEEQTS